MKARSGEDHHLAGVICLNNGELEEGIDHLKKSLRKDSANEVWLFSLACAYALNEQREEALEVLQQAIELNSDNRYYALNCPDFEGLAEDPEFLELMG